MRVFVGWVVGWVSHEIHRVGWDGWCGVGHCVGGGMGHGGMAWVIVEGVGWAMVGWAMGGEVGHEIHRVVWGM